MTIIHISTDYPDGYEPAKTHAISNLVALTQDSFDHHVFSINREFSSVFEALSNKLRGVSPVKILRHKAGLTEMVYDAPDKGILLRDSFERLADAISEKLAAMGIKPTLVHGHKLTMEGIAARKVAQRFDIPYALSIQGNSDQKILRLRPDLRALYSKVFHEARAVFPFAPWALDYVENVLGKRKGATFMLPCASGQNDILTPVPHGPKLVSAFHLRHASLKNFDTMARAAAKTSRTVDGFAFHIAGGGDNEVIEPLTKKASYLGNGSVQLIGPVAHGSIQQWMNKAGGFALLSKRESFGLVFIEALYSGLPILYPKGRAVDGYFDDQPFALCADPSDIDAIAGGMEKLCRDEVVMKKHLHDWQLSSAAEQFRDSAIAAQYSKGLHIALGANPISSPAS